jgi:hypothetical protein
MSTATKPVFRVDRAVDRAVDRGVDRAVDTAVHGRADGTVPAAGLSKRFLTFPTQGKEIGAK